MIDDRSEVGQKAGEWASTIAVFLGRPVPDRARVEVHRSAGVPHVKATVVHLFEGAEGQVDVTHLPHELVHLVAGPSPSRFLAEGLAVYVDGLLGLGRPGWPCYRLMPDPWVVYLRENTLLTALTETVGQIQSVKLRGPDSDGDAVQRAWQLYVVAGSFTGYLLRTLGDTFWPGYVAGACWQDAQELEQLERAWLSQLCPQLSTEELTSLSASLEDARRDRKAGKLRPESRETQEPLIDDREQKE